MRDNTLRARETLVSEQSRLIQYIDRDTQMNVIENHGDFDKQRDILINAIESQNPALSRLFSNNYDAEVREFIEFIEKEHGDITVGNGYDRYTLTDYKEEELYNLPEKNIKQKSRLGKEYVRSKPQKYSEKEVLFISRHREVSDEELYNRYNEKFRPRQKEALMSKRRRL